MHVNAPACPGPQDCSARPGGRGWGCPGLAWGRVKGVGRRVNYLCEGQRRLRETETPRETGCCHFRRWWWSPPSGPQESSRPNLEDPAPTDPKSACPTRDPSFPLLVKLSPPGGRPRVHSCLLQPHSEGLTGGPVPGQACTPGLFSPRGFLQQSSPGLRKPKDLGFQGAPQSSPSRGE